MMKLLTEDELRSAEAFSAECLSEGKIAANQLFDRLIADHRRMAAAIRRQPHGFATNPILCAWADPVRAIVNCTDACDWVVAQ